MLVQNGASQVVLVIRICRCKGHKGCEFDPWVRKLPWGGNDNSFLHSYLEKSLVRGDWWTTLLEAAKSWTWLRTWAHTQARCVNILSDSVFMLVWLLYLWMMIPILEQLEESGVIRDGLQKQIYIKKKFFKPTCNLSNTKYLIILLSNPSTWNSLFQLYFYLKSSHQQLN